VPTILAMHGFGGGALPRMTLQENMTVRGDEGRLRVPTQDAARLLSRMKRHHRRRGTVGLTTASPIAQQGIPCR